MNEEEKSPLSDDLQEALDRADDIIETSRLQANDTDLSEEDLAEKAVFYLLTWLAFHGSDYVTVMKVALEGAIELTGLSH